MKTKQPYIIEIEGTDGSGKQTQTELLNEFLCKSGFKSLRLSFPDYDDSSATIIKQYLSGELGKINPVTPNQASILYAVNRLAKIKSINILDYDFIVLDRYVGSNMIHQAAGVKSSELNDFLAWVDDLEFNKLLLPRPNLVLFLDVPPEISYDLAHARKSLKRKSDKDILEQDKNHYFSAYNTAKYVAQKYGWTIINCTANGKLLTKEEISKNIISIVKTNAKI